MKKLFPLFLILALAFTGCEGGGSQFAGKYNGTFTIIKNNTTKQGSVRITNNPVSTTPARMWITSPKCSPLWWARTISSTAPPKR